MATTWSVLFWCVQFALGYGVGWHAITIWRSMKPAHRHAANAARLVILTCVQLLALYLTIRIVTLGTMTF